jgi:cytochrome b561
MRWKSPSRRVRCQMNEPVMAWPLLVRLAHWVSAALVLGMLAFGAAMVLLVHDAAARFELIQTHKSIGVVILALTIVRLCVRALTSSPSRSRPHDQSCWPPRQPHVALYMLLLLLMLMPLSGWLMATSTPVRVPTVVFGLFELPYPLTPDLERGSIWRTARMSRWQSCSLRSSRCTRRLRLCMHGSVVIKRSPACGGNAWLVRPSVVRVERRRLSLVSACRLFTGPPLGG